MIGDKVDRGVYSLNCVFGSMINIIFLLELLSFHIIFCGIGWVSYFYNFLLRLISIPITFLIVVAIVCGVYIVGVIKGGIDINNVNTMSFSGNIIIISNTNLFTGGVRFKLRIGL